MPCQSHVLFLKTMARQSECTIYIIIKKIDMYLFFKVNFKKVMLFKSIGPQCVPCVFSLGFLYLTWISKFVTSCVIFWTVALSFIESVLLTFFQKSSINIVTFPFFCHVLYSVINDGFAFQALSLSLSLTSSCYYFFFQDKFGLSSLTRRKSSLSYLTASFSPKGYASCLA